jgi:hypothetical protein
MDHMKETSVTVPPDVLELLKPYPPAVQELALAARNLVMHAVPKATEMVDSSAKLIGYGYRSGYKGLICTLILSQMGVKTGIVRGSQLPDPTGLMQGSGKVHRYFILRDITDLKKAGLMPLLKAAVVAWRGRNEHARV